MTLDRAERYLAVLGVFLAPMRDFRPTVIAFTYSDLLFCLLGVLLIVRRRLTLAPLQDASILWMVAVLFLVGGLFASSIVNGSAAASLVVCTQYFFAYAVLPFLILSGDKERAVLLLKTYVYATVAIVVLGFIFVATDYHNDYTYVSGSGRLASLSGNPNNLGNQIGLVMPLLLYLRFSKAMSTLTSLVVFVILIIGLIMTSSNGGIASTALGLAAFLFFAGSFRWMVQGALLAATVVLAVATVGYDYLPPVFQRRVLQGLESGDLEQAGTYKDRMELIIEASEMLDGSLLLGIGADQYRERSYWAAPVHNQYLLVWVEGGTLALVGWMLVLTTAVLVGIRAYQLPSGGMSAAVVLATVAIFAMMANTTPHLYARSWILPVFIAMGVAIADRMAFFRRDPLARYRAIPPPMPSRPGAPPLGGPRLPGRRPD